MKIAASFAVLAAVATFSFGCDDKAKTTTPPASGTAAKVEVKAEVPATTATAPATTATAPATK